MENKSHALVAGAFVLVLMGLVIALAMWLSRDSSIRRIYEVSSAVAVTGLQPEATVRFKGVEVGKVTAIGFDPQRQGNVLIRLAVEDSAPITRSTFATLAFQGVTGLSFVQLDDDAKSAELLTSNSDKPARIPLHSSLLSNLSDKGVSILTELETSSHRVNDLLAQENQKNLMSSVAHMGQAADSIRKLADHTDQLLDTQLAFAVSGLPQLVEQTSTTLDVIKATSLRVGDSADEARKSAAAFRAVTQRMAEKGGTLDRIDQSAEQLGQLTQTVNTTTMPRLNRAVGDTARAVRSVDKMLGDNPQALIFGNGAPLPGPGEAGFKAPASQP